MKHVWILNHYAQEPGGPGGTRHFSLARHLADHGWKVTIIAASTEHGTGRQRLGPNEAIRHECFDGVSFLWLRVRNYAGNGMDRVLNMLDYTRAVLVPNNVAGLEAPDVVIGSSVHPLAAWAGRRLSRRFDVPFVFEVRDLWPQTLIDMGQFSKRHPAAVALRRLELSLYRSARKIIVLLPFAGEYIEPLGIPREKIVWIPNGVDLARFPASPLRADNEVFTLMYFGAHGPANGLDNLIKAMRIAEEKSQGRRILLRLIGDGPSKSELRELAADSAAIRFESAVPKANIPNVAAEADAFVICVRDLPQLYRFGISMNKIFDYMAAQRPVIISANAPNNPIEESGSGLTVQAENPDALASAILEMAEYSTELRQEMGVRGRRYLEEHYDMAILADLLSKTLDDCLRAS